jgi:hypothetical protein
MSSNTTYNPLIGTSTAETLYYVRCALFTLQDFANYASGKDDTDIGGASTIGLCFILQCINEAIRYETEQRM